jgi:hypothetical protein
MSIPVVLRAVFARAAALRSNLGASFPRGPAVFRMFLKCNMKILHPASAD